MKVAIITLCEAVNYGAYLQAYSMKEFLESNGCEVEFIRSYSFKMLKTSIKSLYTYRHSKAKFKSEFRKEFFECQKLLKKTYNKKGFDAIVIGSDEVWQVLNPTASPKKIFFGNSVSAKIKIAYAACSNNTKYEDAIKLDYVKPGIESLDAVSVRDIETLDAYRPLIGNAPIVLDPTFLVDIEKYISFNGVCDFKYVLVYTYGFTEERINMVKQFAKKRGLKIISVGQLFEWVDYSFPCSAFEFLGFIKNAEYVFTDTFHGTILSMQLKKSFFSFGYKSKVKRVLEQFGLEERNISKNSKIERIADCKIDYDKVFEIVDSYKKDSLEFLNSNLLKRI